MNSLGTYVKQRVNVALWSIIAAILIALSATADAFSLFQLYSLPFVLFFLVTMRLFDDLASAKVDEGKENRAYTNAETKSALRKYLVGAQLLLLSMLVFFDMQRAVVLLVFFAVNQVLYFFLFEISGFRYFLPLIKYPFVIYILRLKLSLVIPLVYAVAVIIEMATDKHFLKKTNLTDDV